MMSLCTSLWALLCLALSYRETAGETLFSMLHSWWPAAGVCGPCSLCCWRLLPAHKINMQLVSSVMPHLIQPGDKFTQRTTSVNTENSDSPSALSLCFVTRTVDVFYRSRKSISSICSLYTCSTKEDLILLWSYQPLHVWMCVCVYRCSNCIYLWQEVLCQVFVIKYCGPENEIYNLEWISSVTVLSCSQPRAVIWHLKVWPSWKLRDK